MQLAAGRTRLRAAHGQGRVLPLFTALVIYSLINFTSAWQLPKILQPANNTVIAKKGEGLRILCKVQTRWLRLHNVYWLVNNTFVEDAYPDGRVTEESGGAVAVKGTVERPVEQTLKFTRMQPEDFRNVFTCVVQDPSGTAVKHFILIQELDGKSNVHSVRLMAKNGAREKDPERRQQ